MDPKRQFDFNNIRKSVLIATALWHSKAPVTFMSRAPAHSRRTKIGEKCCASATPTVHWLCAGFPLPSAQNFSDSDSVRAHCVPTVCTGRPLCAHCVPCVPNVCWERLLCVDCAPSKRPKRRHTADTQQKSRKYNKFLYCVPNLNALNALSTHCVPTVYPGRPLCAEQTPCVPRNLAKFYRRTQDTRKNWMKSEKILLFGQRRVNVLCAEAGPMNVTAPLQFATGCHNSMHNLY